MRNLHVVSHTHWDREWYQPFQVFRLRLVHLVDGLLDLLDKDKDFKYFMLDGQTIVLDDYLLMRPEKESILRDHIRKGRILIGPWHILPDMFLVGPEAHIRNLQQGERTARRFGQKMMIGYMPDSFGHIGQVPQILCGFGINVASVWRGVLDGPAEFWWQSPDGSRVLMAYLRNSYGNGADLPADNLEQFANLLGEKGDDLAEKSVTADLLIMYGTDHMEPPRNTSEAIAYADEMLRNTHVLHSSIPQYIKAIEATIRKENIELPIIIGELRSSKRMHLLPGVLSTRMWIKQSNHASEVLLEKWVEPFHALASLALADKKPQNSTINSDTIIAHAWHILMENHPHDSICGCSIDQVHEEMKVRFDQVDQIGDMVLNQSLESIANSIDTDSGPVASNTNASKDFLSSLIVLNPSHFQRADLLHATVELPHDVTGYELVDENGKSLPFQERGVGSTAIINTILDPKMMRSMFGNINDGRAAGMTIQEIKINRINAEVYIEATMANGGDPNISAWNAGREAIEVYLGDPSVTTYHLNAHSVSTRQITFVVPDVPCLGYRTIWIRALSHDEKAPFHLNPLFKFLLPFSRLPLFKNIANPPNDLKPGNKIENEYFIVSIENGTITLKDKSTGVVSNGLNRFMDGGDCGDEYNYSPPDDDRLIKPKCKRVRLTDGVVLQSIVVELELSIPASLSPNRKARSKKRVTVPITTTLSLVKGVPRIDIHTTIDNHACDHRLRVHFPASFTAENGSHDGHFEVVDRPIGIPDFDETWVEQPRPEVPQQAFTSVTDGKTGLTIANRGLPEVEILKNSSGNAEVAITLLRCVGWLSRDDFSTRKGHAGPFLETPSAQMPGTWNFDYSILSHPGDWRYAFPHAYSFITPLKVIPAPLHHGTLPTLFSFVQVDPAVFVISAIKHTDEGKNLLVRGFNITGETIKVDIRSWRGFKKVERVNIAENKSIPLKPARDGCVTFLARGHEIVNLKFRD